MAIVKLGVIDHFIGLSTDEKLTAPAAPGSTFYETDTQNTYVYDGAAWDLAAITFAGTTAVTEADGANVALGARNATAATTDTGTFSLIALFKRGLTKLTAIAASVASLLPSGTQATLLTSDAHTATQTLAFTNPGRGIQVCVDVTAYTAGGLTPVINGLDSLGIAYALTATLTKISGTGTYVYEVYPGVGAAAGGITATSSHAVPATGQVVLTVDDATAITYSVTISYLP